MNQCCGDKAPERCGDCPERTGLPGTIRAPEFTLPETVISGPPAAPEGYEWVLLPARPGGPPAPGETGHYSDLNPEPIQIHEAWGLSFLEGSALKYLARYKKKGGVEDLQKVKFYADRMIAREIREGRGK